MKNDIWYKFYECDCHAEGIMLSHEWEDDDIAYLAFFTNCPQYSDNRMRLKDKLRWCWRILSKGMPFTDMMVLNKETALTLAGDLIKFGVGQLGKE